MPTYLEHCEIFSILSGSPTVADENKWSNVGLEHIVAD